jgi:hypothetical protein
VLNRETIERLAEWPGKTPVHSPRAGRYSAPLPEDKCTLSLDYPLKHSAIAARHDLDRCCFWKASHSPGFLAFTGSIEARHVYAKHGAEAENRLPLPGRDAQSGRLSQLIEAGQFQRAAMLWI